MKSGYYVGSVPSRKSGNRRSTHWMALLTMAGVAASLGVALAFLGATVRGQESGANNPEEYVMTVGSSLTIGATRFWYLGISITTVETAAPYRPLGVIRIRAVDLGESRRNQTPLELTYGFKMHRIDTPLITAQAPFDITIINLRLHVLVANNTHLAFTLVTP